MKVLIAVDGSAGSFEAVDQMGRVLAAERDELVMYCAPPEVQVRARQVDPSVLARATEGFADAIFDEARKRLPVALAARTSTVVGKHDPRQGVIAEAEAHSADLIAVGARGLSSLERLLLGSVSRGIVHRSTIPVWVARAKGGHPRARMNVLLACEKPELGQTAAALLAQFNWPAESSFATISAVPSIFAGRVPDWLEQQARGPDVEEMVKAWAQEHEAELNACRRCMEEFARSLPPPWNQCRALVVEGEPAREILAALTKEDVDLVVIGSEHKRTLANMILGSTSEAVLNHAGCSVLVVPHRVGA